VMIDGDPTWPTLDWQWQLAGVTRPTCMGVSPTFVMASRNAGLQPGAAGCLDSIRTFPLAGSPLPIAGYRYLNEQLPADALLLNGSGGTDVCTAIVGGTRIQPVYEGKISGPCLGVAAKAFDPDGNEIVNQLGELVITEPMPSMPVGFWNDPDGSRYRGAYFEHYPGVWRHGDWIRFTPQRTCQVTGRSDATLNRGGVRLGTGESTGCSTTSPRSPTASSSTSRTKQVDRVSCCCSSCSSRARHSPTSFNRRSEDHSDESSRLDTCLTRS
jgi:acetoacetyl-CoA synthetase